MTDEWYDFDWDLTLIVKPIAGVYELTDKDGITLYIGGGENLRACLERLLKETDSLHSRQKVRLCRVSYRDDYKSHVQSMRKLYQDVFETNLVCLDS